MVLMPILISASSCLPNLDVFQKEEIMYVKVSWKTKFYRTASHLDH